MRRTGPPRLNRFPQRLDYTLIPAPLDLSRPLIDEKSPLPAIIVTPSSPSHDGDFAIAFLVPPPKPSVFQRLAQSLPSWRPQSYLPSQIQLPQSTVKPEFEHNLSAPSSCKTRTRATIILLLLLFIMGCHVAMHSLLNGRPHLEFGFVSDNDIGTLATPASSDLFGNAADARAEELSTPVVGGWFNFNTLWAPIAPTDAKRTPDFVVWDARKSEGGAV